MGAIAERDPRKKAYPVGAGVLLMPGTPAVIVNGYLQPVSVLTGITAGVTTMMSDNSTGANGAIRAEVVTGDHQFVNAGDITVAHVGQTAYWVDDSVVSISDATATRNSAGTITQVDSTGVWVSLGLR